MVRAAHTFYGLEDGKTVIDGEGMGAYLNHSCDPNCEVDEIKNRVWDTGHPQYRGWRRSCYGLQPVRTMTILRPATAARPSAVERCIRGNGWLSCGS